jgi:hemoglobin-like flavoprotein
VGLDDREGLALLRAAVDPDAGSEELIRRFYTRWFAIDTSAADLFPPDMTGQRVAFARALTWLFGELIARRAEEPVAFLAQLGRDHRKYGVTQRHYDSMRDALETTLRSHLIEQWDEGLAGTG